MTSQGPSAHARAGGRGLEGGEQRQVGEGRPRKGLRFAGTCCPSRRLAVDASGTLSGREGKPLSAVGSQARPAEPAHCRPTAYLSQQRDASHIDRSGSNCFSVPSARVQYVDVFRPVVGTKLLSPWSSQNFSSRLTCYSEWPFL